MAPTSRCDVQDTLQLAAPGRTILQIIYEALRSVNENLRSFWPTPHEVSLARFKRPCIEPKQAPQEGRFKLRYGCQRIRPTCLPFTDGLKEKPRAASFEAARGFKWCMVPEARIELARHCWHKILSLACLPIPPPGQGSEMIQKKCRAVQLLCAAGLVNR